MPVLLTGNNVLVRLEYFNPYASDLHNVLGFLKGAMFISVIHNTLSIGWSYALEGGKLLTTLRRRTEAATAGSLPVVTPRRCGKALTRVPPTYTTTIISGGVTGEDYEGHNLHSL